MRHNAAMIKLRKVAVIKARVDKRTKSQLAALAVNRDLDISDLVREAVRELLARNQKTAVAGAL